MTAAVITGASAGLGAEFTRQLVREFPEIEEFWLIARRVGKLEELAQQFPDKKFVCMGLNLLDPKSFRYLGEKLAEQKADVRVLVNNAGCGTTGNIGFGATSADVMRVVDLNVRALTMVTQTVIPFMTRVAASCSWTRLRNSRRVRCRRCANLWNPDMSRFPERKAPHTIRLASN